MNDATIGLASYRPVIAAQTHAVATGHYGATHAAFQILEAGGNAVDAGVAAGLALGVLQSDIVNVAGVAPTLIYLAERDEVVSIAGLGTWPRMASAAHFVEHHGGAIPKGLLRTVVPAAPAAWIKALGHYGTMSFSDVARAAIGFARDGFAMHPLMAEVIASHEADYRRWTSTADIYLPGGHPPKVDELFVQSDLARSLQYMCDEEAARSADGRLAGLKAARAAFYEGDIAATFVDYHKANGGWLRMEDMAGFDAEIEAPVRIAYKDYGIYCCQPWCQGISLSQAFKIVEGIDLKALGHNSPDYVHTMVEALKIAFADRERFLGDPKFVDVPVEQLLSADYAARRRAEIRLDRAYPGLPPAADGSRPASVLAAEGMPAQLDTSYVGVVDKFGNAFSATPSDTSSESPVIPGTGMVPSMRGTQNWSDPSHASVLAPGKRPRLTPSPALALGRAGAKGREVVPFGTPGGDVQIQAMLQCFVNMTEFGMNPQQAIEAPRFATYSFPDSFQPHDYRHNMLMLEARFPHGDADDLGARGHEADWWPQFTWRAGGMCMLHKDPDTGLMLAGADPRRTAYALGI